MDSYSSSESNKSECEKSRPKRSTKFLQRTSLAESSSESPGEKVNGKQTIINTKRGNGRKNKKFKKKFKIWGSNANGIISKQDSLKDFLDIEKPSCFFIQETKCTRIGQVKVDGYQMFDTVRKKSGGGGGILIGIQNEEFSNPIVICQGEENVEILVVQIKIGGMSVRLSVSYTHLTLPTILLV